MDFYPTDLADVFTSLCHCPPSSSSVLFLNTDSSLIPLTLQGASESLITVNVDDPNIGNGLVRNLGAHFDDIASRIHVTTSRDRSNDDEFDTTNNEYYDDIDELEMFTHDSILTDVPSTNDRVSLNEMSLDNVFHPIHTHTRQSFPMEQKKILKKAIQLCRPGGYVTYTSCTMSHLQNEYCVQSAVKELLMDYQITVRSVPLHLVSFALPEVATYDHSKLGQLVLPRLGQNYGPRYICKLLIE